MIKVTVCQNIISTGDNKLIFFVWQKKVHRAHHESGLFHWTSKACEKPDIIFSKMEYSVCTHHSDGRTAFGPRLARPCPSTHTVRALRSAGQAPNSIGRTDNSLSDFELQFSQKNDYELKGRFSKKSSLRRNSRERDFNGNFYSEWKKRLLRYLLKNILSERYSIINAML